MTNPILPWQGGKRRLAKQLLPLFPEHKCYVEPFAGGAALFFLKEESKVEVLNDINGELINLYRVIKHHLEEFLRHFKWSLTSREVYKDLLETDPSLLTDIQRAERFFYLQKLAFGARVAGQTFGTATTSKPRLNLLRLEEDLSAAHMRLARTTIELLAWNDCIERYDREHSFFYLDPPYLDTAGYGNDFDLEQYHMMAELMSDMKGNAMLSINDHPTIREIFKNFKMINLSITYTIGGGKNSKKARELAIMNY